MDTQAPPKHKYRQKPTQKQLVALQLIASGSTARQAMLKAGYSEKVAKQPGNKLYKSNVAISIMDKVRVQLNHAGLTTAYIVDKYKGLIENGDDKTQLEAIRDISKMWGVNQTQDKKTPSRVITLEEYLDDDTSGKVSSKSNDSELISSEVSTD